MRKSKSNFEELIEREWDEAARRRIEGHDKGVKD
jgi:hypothetical protein